MRSYNLLLVDDDPIILKSLTRALLEEERRKKYKKKYNIFTTTNSFEAFEIVENFKIHLVISDEKMPQMQGHEFLRRIRTMDPHIMRIILTGQTDFQIAIKAINEGEIYRFLTKPWDNFELNVIVNQALNLFDLEAKNRYLLKKVNQQAATLRILEHRYPEIAATEAGIEEMARNIGFVELTDEEISELIAQYEHDEIMKRKSSPDDNEIQKYKIF
ncbi:MAG: response regulator [bacterium]|nr:response regulator [bacterium]